MPATAKVLPELAAAAEVQVGMALVVMIAAVVAAAMIPRCFCREARSGMAVAAATSNARWPGVAAFGSMAFGSMPLHLNWAGSYLAS